MKEWTWATRNHDFYLPKGNNGDEVPPSLHLDMTIIGDTVQHNATYIHKKM